MEPFKLIIGFTVAFLLGAMCRYLGVPIPAPPTIIGVMLILAVTCGAMAVDWYLNK